VVTWKAKLPMSTSAIQKFFKCRANFKGNAISRKSANKAACRS